jgi:hypothetical protein
MWQKPGRVLRKQTEPVLIGDTNPDDDQAPQSMLDGAVSAIDRRRAPGRVTKIIGVIFQSDNESFIAAWLIRPIQTLDRRLAGLRQSTFGPPVAMHVGLHVQIEVGTEFVVEQLFATPRNAFLEGLNWTPLEVFRARNRGGWDVTVPATAFRKIDDRVVKEALEFLNGIQGRPYVSEDCPSFVERAFGRRRLFAHSPTVRWLGLGVRMGDPALPLLRPDVQLDRRTERLLRVPLLRTLPDPVIPWNPPNARFLFHRLVLGVGILLAWMIYRLRNQRFGTVKGQ